MLFGDEGRSPDKQRSCGGCQLCCRLMPIKETGTSSETAFLKAAGTRCQHQKHRKGCSIYPKRPTSCMMWSCAWLLDTLPSSFPRPDRAGYVVDPSPDTITYIPDDDPDNPVDIPVIQVWVDKRYIKNGALRLPEYWGPYIDAMADDGYGFIFRENSRDAITAIRYKGDWIIGRGKMKPSTDQLKDMFTAYVY